MVVSVLMPVRNGIEFMHGSIASVQNQTHTDWELIVGLNRISPQSEEFSYANSFSSERIRVVNLGDTKGGAEALNRMVSLAQGETLCLLDVDDVWHPYKLAKQLPLMKTYDVVGTNCDYFGDRSGMPGIMLGPVSSEAMLSCNHIINSSSMFSRKDAAWDEDIEGQHDTDYDMWLRLAFEGKTFFNVADTLTYHRIHTGSAYNTRELDVSGLRKRWQRRFAARKRPRRRMVIGILSAAGYEDRRKRCRDTWLGDASSFDLDYFFLIGDGGDTEYRVEGDMLYMPCPDDYASLPQKTRCFARYVHENYDFDHLVKVDDDTYVCLDKIMAYGFGDHPYTGSDWCGYASGGGGYVLNRSATKVVVDNLTHQTGNEDELVGQVLQSAGVQLSHSEAFQGFTVRTQKRPTFENDVITAHGINAEMWDEIHQSVVNAVNSS